METETDKQMQTGNDASSLTSGLPYLPALLKETWEDSALAEPLFSGSRVSRRQM